MKLFVPQYIENMLSRATYEYDETTRNWCAYVEALPGAYAQADTIEEVRAQLAEVIEDYDIITMALGSA